MIAGLTSAERAALVLLGALGRQTGRQLVAASAGLLARGTVYVHLARLIERGWVEAREVEDLVSLPSPSGPVPVRLRRNVYGLTPVGRLELDLLHEAWGRSAA